MNAWRCKRGVRLANGDLDETPYDPLQAPHELAHHVESVRVLRRSSAFAMAVAGDGKSDS